MLQAGGGQYGGTYATLKLQIGIVAADGAVLTREASYFKEYTLSHGLAVEDLGRSFTLKTRRFTIKGFNIRSRKIMLETPDKRQWTMRPDHVKEALAKEVQS